MWQGYNRGCDIGLDFSKIKHFCQRVSFFHSFFCPYMILSSYLSKKASERIVERSLSLTKILGSVRTFMNSDVLKLLV